MIRSMTGFGDAERNLPESRVRVEIKSVNHRFFNGTVRLPSGLDRHESMIVDRLKKAISRGSVTFSLSVERIGGGGSDAPLPGLDLERARAYVAALRTAGEDLGLASELGVDVLARFPEIFRTGESRPRWSEVTPELLAELAEEGLERLVASREAEGARLKSDFLERLDAIVHLVDRVGERAPDRLVRERDRLRAAVSELSEASNVDEDRLAREITYLADKWDISEEIVRLRSHVELFREVITQEAPAPVGKRLGFVLQELNREANTVGSKANDTDIAHYAVGLKEEIERMREQVENVE